MYCHIKHTTRRSGEYINLQRGIQATSDGAVRLTGLPQKPLVFSGFNALAASQGQGLNEFDRGGLFSLDFCAEKSG